MILSRLPRLSQQDREAYRVSIAFLSGRLRERATIEWALRLKSKDSAQQIAVLELIERSDAKDLGEPWITAWSLVREYWDTPNLDNSSVDAYGVRHRLRAGDLTGAVISEIIRITKPYLKLSAFSKSDFHFRKPPARPKVVTDIMSASLTSGELIDPTLLDIPTIENLAFLSALANGLEAAIVMALDTAKQFGWDGTRQLWRLGQLHRVYYQPGADRPAGVHEPDEFHRGIAPSVKLLHSVVVRIAELTLDDAIAWARRCKLVNSPIYMRLWAALSRDPRMTSADEVGAWLLSLNDRQFWNVLEFPEIAELRALRFTELDHDQQAAVTSRLRRRPPRILWPKKTPASRVEAGRQYWTVREFRRLVVGSANLSPSDQAWLDNTSAAFPDLAQMTRLDHGFLDSPQAHWVGPQPDNRFNLISGAERLRELESALSSSRATWDDDPARRAADWIRERPNSIKLIADFESVGDSGAAAGRVWEQFGWAHAPSPDGSDQLAGEADTNQAARVLVLLHNLPEATIRVSIEGISHWLQSWEKQIATLPNFYPVWSKLWPIAVATTNAMQPEDEEADLNTVARPSNDHEPMDLDTLNTSTGRLLSVFLAACPTIHGSDRPFDQEGPLRSMREAIESTTGRSWLIAQHRFIEALPYFLRADSEWAHAFLLAPMLADNAGALVLWRAVARQTQFYEVLKIIGASMAERAIDRRLGRQTRQSLVLSLVVECLHALKDGREPAVPYSRVQQMLRSLEDEVRAHAADTIRRFIEGVSSGTQDGVVAPTPEALFHASAAPFLEQVWPQERSLNAPSISRAFAHLPSATREAFAAAVAAVDRFLVPFECWSLLDYGLYGDENGRAKLSSIDTPEKATAFLRLLDRTIGSSEGSVIPHDLSDALQQIRLVSPTLEHDAIFSRLATAARR